MSSPLLRAQQDHFPLTDHRRFPALDEMVDVFDFELGFHSNVPLPVFDYVAHGTDSEFTVRRNREAFEWVEVVARGEADAGSVNTAVEILGTKMDYPILVAPTGSQGLLYPSGDKGMYEGASAANTLLITSHATSFSVEDIAAAANGQLWFQIYMRQDREYNREALERAQAVGCRAIVVTIDQQATFFERDLHDRHLGEPAGRRSRRRRSEPSNPYGVSDARLWYEWRYLDEIRTLVDLPMLAKGVLTGEDALLCLQHGMDGIIVSNHGGRSLDYAPSSLEVLPEVLQAVQGRVPVLIDSGFRRGIDILKALALGADAVCLGRVPLWGLGGYGPAGVQRVLELVQGEFVRALADTGRPTPASLDPKMLRTDFP